MPHVKKPEETMLTRDNKDSRCKPRQQLKCEFGMHDWKTTKMVKYCQCCRKRKWRPIDSDGNYINQTTKGIYIIRCTVRTTNDEPSQNHQFFCTSLLQVLFRCYRLVRVWGVYHIEITWSPL